MGPGRFFPQYFPSFVFSLLNQIRENIIFSLVFLSSFSILSIFTPTKRSLNFQNACSNTHILSIHKRSIELLPYKDFPICRLSRNVSFGHPWVQLHVISKVRHVLIQCRCIGKKFPSMGPLVNVDSMFLLPIPL